MERWNPTQQELEDLYAYAKARGLNATYDPKTSYLDLEPLYPDPTMPNRAHSFLAPNLLQAKLRIDKF